MIAVEMPLALQIGAFLFCLLLLVGWLPLAIYMHVGIPDDAPVRRILHWLKNE